MNISNNINNNSVAYLSAPINNRAAYQAPNSFASTSSTISLPQILTLLNQLVSLLSNGSLNTNNPASYNANAAGGFNPQNRHMGQPMQPNHFGYNASAQNNPMSPAAAYQPASLPWTNVNVNQYSPMQQGFQNPNAHGAHYAAPAMPNAAQRDMGQATIFNGHGINQNAIAADNNGVINQRVAAPGFADPRGMNHPAMPAMPNQPGMNHPAMPAMPNQGGMNPAVAANKPADAEPKKADKHAGHNHGHKKAAKKPEAMPEMANKPAMRNMNPQGMNGVQGMPSMDMNGMNQAGMPGMNMNGMNQAGMPGMNMNGMNQAGMPGMNMNGMNQAGMPGMNGIPGMNMNYHAMPGMGMENMLGEDGKMKPGHDFYAHVSHMYSETLAPNQARYGGYSWINDSTLVAKSPITGMQPVIDQAIADVMKKPANKRLSIGELESKVANRLTQLNDWKTLTKDTQEKLVNLTGIDFGKMTKAEREKSINHLLHSPLPFGAVTEILTPDMRVDLGFTHTLDQNKTMFNDLGNGLFNITLISNNNNGSHTGHNLGSFNVQLDADATDKDAKKAVKEMLVNTNNNNRLYLDSVARDQLYQYKAT